MGLLHLLILLTFAKLQDSAENSSAWQWALGFAGVTFLFVFFDGDVMAGAITAAFGVVFMGLFRPAAAAGR